MSTVDARIQPTVHCVNVMA